MVNTPDKMFKLYSEKITYQRHQGLKNPNHNPHDNAVLNENFLAANPLHIETEKASMERAMLIQINDSKSMSYSFVLQK